MVYAYLFILPSNGDLIIDIIALGLELNVTTLDESAMGQTEPKFRYTEALCRSKEIAAETSLDDAELYLNRELTWLSFNQRVLNEAQDPRNPLLERLKFIAIVSNNLDEFFMKRIGGLKQLVGAGIQSVTVDGRTPQQQTDDCYHMVKLLEKDKRKFLSKLLKQLEQEDIVVHRYSQIDSKIQTKLRDQYFENIFPLLTPQGMDPAHPFPFISNLSLNLLVTLRPKNAPLPTMARVKIPVGAGVPRFLQINEDKNHFVPIEDVVASNLDLLFPDVEILSCETFRVTRNANTERNEDNADDLLSMIESELRDRRFAPIVRLQVQDSMTTMHKGMLAAELGLDEENDVFAVEGMMGMCDLFQLAGLKLPELHDKPHFPTDHPLLHDAPSIFHAIREHGSILLHHPYQSFSTSVERFLREAADDPKVRAIKMTLYRTSSGTKVIDYLIRAARNGKQVAVGVELKARFDEAANIRWASRMEEAGIHVTYGIVGLKTHSKVILVVRQDYSYNKIRCYAHIGTGNYHADTARLYSDLGLLTCDQDLGADLTQLFNYLTTGYTPQRQYKKILPSPKILKNTLIDYIKREAKLHTEKNPGLIQFKMNALEDADVTKALYQAACSGVRIDLIIRDTCRLRPGVVGFSDNIHIYSLVGRFLEHSRIYYFRNQGADEYYIGSADAMQRNLESRVEVVTPVDQAELKGELRMILDTQLQDKRSRWEMQADGSSCLAVEEDADHISSQAHMIAFYDNKHRKARQLKKNKLATGGKRKKSRNKAK